MIGRRTRSASVLNRHEADLEAIHERALEEGIPYQSLLLSVLHKFATGRIG